MVTAEPSTQVPEYGPLNGHLAGHDEGVDTNVLLPTVYQPTFAYQYQQTKNIL